MINNVKSIIIILLAVTSFSSCKKTEYNFGNIKTPSDLSIAADIKGATSSTPNGDGSGLVTITAKANDAITYKIYLGNGDSVLTSSGITTYKYSILDTNTYTITVNATGTGGATSSLSKQIKVYYLFPIPDEIDNALTNGSSRSWKIAKDSVGNFGVGPVTTFTPDWYKSGPNEKPSCAYGTTVTFAHVATNNISVNVDNQGSSFIIGAAAPFYGQSGGDGCYPITTSGAQTLTLGTDDFAGANSSNSTGIQITVPGNGLVGFGTGATTYEILYLSSRVMVLRNIGSDGNAWYQILKAN